MCYKYVQYEQMIKMKTTIEEMIQTLNYPSENLIGCASLTASSLDLRGSIPRTE